MKANDWDLKEVFRLLKNPKVCAPENFHELFRTPTMQKRLLELNLIQPYVKPPSKKELLKRDIESLLRRFDREKLYDEVWENPVKEVAKVYGVSDVYLGRVCRTLRVPVPPRGYWAMVRSGKKVKKPKLPVLRY